MGLKWSLSALVATIALVLIGGAIINKAKNKKDSPLYSLISKLKGFKNKDENENENEYYKRLSHKGGIKW